MHHPERHEMPVTTRQLKAQLSPGWQVKLRNVRINEAPVGCSGFLTDPKTGRVIYLTTDFGIAPPKHLRGKAMYRTARNDRDFDGGTNRYCEITELGQHLKALFHAPQPHWY